MNDPDTVQYVLYQQCTKTGHPEALTLAATFLVNASSNSGNDGVDRSTDNW